METSLLAEIFLYCITGLEKHLNRTMATCHEDDIRAYFNDVLGYQGDAADSADLDASEPEKPEDSKEPSLIAYLGRSPAVGRKP